jgi:Gamma-glutamyl cyclotransferase, AIG2-like
MLPPAPAPHSHHEQGNQFHPVLKPPSPPDPALHTQLESIKLPSFTELASPRAEQPGFDSQLRPLGGASETLVYPDKDFKTAEQPYSTTPEQSISDFYSQKLSYWEEEPWPPKGPPFAPGEMPPSPPFDPETNIGWQIGMWIMKHGDQTPLPPHLRTGTATSSTPSTTFRPGYFFFYGSLMDADVLQTIAQLPSLPILERGYITNWRVRMWGVYPTIVPGNGEDRVEGTLWFAPRPEHVERLVTYETGA